MGGRFSSHKYNEDLWIRFVANMRNAKKEVRIALLGDQKLVESMIKKLTYLINHINPAYPILFYGIESVDQFHKISIFEQFVGVIIVTDASEPFRAANQYEELFQNGIKAIIVGLNTENGNQMDSIKIRHTDSIYYTSLKKDYDDLGWDESDFVCMMVLNRIREIIVLEEQNEVDLNNDTRLR
jgi:hypothetical protein